MSEGGSAHSNVHNLHVDGMCYGKASFKGAYERDPFRSVFAERRLRSTRADITNALVIVLDNVVVLSDHVESYKYN